MLLPPLKQMSASMENGLIGLRAHPLVETASIVERELEKMGMSRPIPQVRS